MTEISKPFDNLNKNAEQAVKQAERTVEQTMDHTRGVFENYFDFVQKAFSSYPLGGTELTETLRNNTERNIATAQVFVHNLSQAKDLSDVIRIQTEYMRTQFETFVAQTKSVTEAFTKATTGAMQNPFNKSR
jgi:hypothetical protein